MACLEDGRLYFSVESVTERILQQPCEKMNEMNSNDNLDCNGIHINSGDDDDDDDEK